MNLLSRRYLYFLLSAIIILPGLVLIAINGLSLSIDFTGGSLLEIQFNSGKAPAPADVLVYYNSQGITDAQVLTSGEDKLIIRSSFMEEEKLSKIESGLETEFNDTLTIISAENVGPTIGAEVANRALLAVLVAALGVVIYITFAFRGIQHAVRYGVCAILAMLHDSLVVISITAMGSALFGWQVDSLFLTALLTVIGFSVQDKIVVFDRIRENSTIFRRLPFETLVNHSIIQTLQRSINTQLMTSEFMLLALALLGGVTLREFSVILMIGLLMGTYSSIFIAAPLLVVWEKKEWQTWFGRKDAAAV